MKASLKITQDFDVPLEKYFEACRSTILFKHLGGDDENRARRFYPDEAYDGTLQGVDTHCEFRDIRPYKYIIFTWHTQSPLVEGDSTVTIIFNKNGDGCEVELAHEGLSSEEAVQTFNKQWQTCLDAIAREAPDVVF